MAQRLREWQSPAVSNNRLYQAESESLQHCMSSARVSCINESRGIEQDTNIRQNIDNKCAENSQNQHKKSNVSQLFICPIRTSPSIPTNIHNDLFFGHTPVNAPNKIDHRFKKGRLRNKLPNSFNQQNQQKQLLTDCFNVPHNCHKNPLSAHPFRRHKLDQHKGSKENAFSEQQTGLSLEDDLEDQFERNAVPGPGSYQISTIPSKSMKNSFMFAGDRDRFQDMYKKQCPNECRVYELKRPRNNRSNIKKKGSRIGFGTSMTVERNQAKTKNGDFVFFEDLNNIGNKALCYKLKDTIQPGNFMSQQLRFANQKQQQTGSQFDLQYAEALQKKNQQPRAFVAFNSATSRKSLCTNSAASAIDYHGQQHGTIKQKVEKNEEQHQLIDDGISPPAFCSSSNRFNYAQRSKGGRKRSHLEIKHQLVETPTGFRPRMRKIDEKKSLKRSLLSSKNLNRREELTINAYDLLARVKYSF